MQYIHGGDVYRHSVEYDFSVNVNPLGMPEESIQAAKEGILLSAVHYPDYRGEALCQALAKKMSVKQEQIILGNGAAELLYGLCQFLRPDKGRILAPSFQEYEQALKSVGARLAEWDLREEESFELAEDFVDSIQGEEDVVFLCNPNNPIGNTIEKNLLLRIAKQCEKTGTYLCLDECFLPFLEPEKEKELSMMKELEKYPHLIILRAFTKIYGMPGLRLGYACTSNKWLLTGIRGVLQPWNTSIPAQLAGLAALRDEEYLRRTYKLLAEEKEYLVKELSDGLTERLYSSMANYIFFKSRIDLKDRLLEKKILIRSCANYRNLSEGYFRIAVRTHEQNRELIRRWREM